MREPVMTDTARISVQVTPRASRSEVVGFEGETLRVRVHAPPVDSRANRAMTELLASTLRIAKSDVRVVAGQASRRKVVAIDGLTGDEVRKRLADLR